MHLISSFSVLNKYLAISILLSCLIACGGGGGGSGGLAPEPTKSSTPKPVIPPTGDPNTSSPPPVVNPPSDDLTKSINRGADHYQQQCLTCHGDKGESGIGGSLTQCNACNSVDALSKAIHDTMPLNKVEACQGQCASDVAAFIMNDFQRQQPLASKVNRFVLRDYPSTLRRFSIGVIGRPPSTEELQQAQTESGFDAVVKNMMTEPGFGHWIKLTFNDLLLTDKYRFNAKSMIRDSDYHNDIPLPSWGEMFYAVSSRDPRCRGLVWDPALAQEPLELVRYVAENDLPLSTILTANYKMVNAYTQHVYQGTPLNGDRSKPIEFRKKYRRPDSKTWVCTSYEFPGIVNGFSMEDRWYPDPEHFVPVTIDRSVGGVWGANPPKIFYDEESPLPLAGILTSEMFLERYPSNSTNRNRLRAATVLKYFHDIDIGASQVDNFVSEGYDIPVMQDPNCTGCHDILDPVASSFRNWDSAGRYMPPSFEFRGNHLEQRQQRRHYHLWSQNGMKAPGFDGVEAPSDQVPNQLQWLAKKIVENDRYFTSAMIRTLYAGLLGKYDNPVYFRSLYDEFKQKGVDTSNIKALVLALVKLDDYRIDGVEDNSTDQASVRSVRLLSPEMLQRKIHRLTGIPWRTFYDPTVGVLYGGIDSDSYINRLDTLNGVSTTFSERMASEMACISVPNDITKAVENRLLFPYAGREITPTSDENILKIKQNIVHLHQWFLGESLEIDSVEVEKTYELFIGVHKIISEDNDGGLAGACHMNQDLEFDPMRGKYRIGLPGHRRISNDHHMTVKPWIAVVNYLMLDYKFLHE